MVRRMDTHSAGHSGFTAFSATLSNFDPT